MVRTQLYVGPLLTLKTRPQPLPFQPSRKKIKKVVIFSSDLQRSNVRAINNGMSSSVFIRL